MSALRQPLALAALLAAGVVQAKATVLIFNGDPADQGFNDPTPVDAVGGNTATTLGGQRLAVFEEAARIWGEQLDSTVPITVLAHFTPLTCDNTGAVLGSAGPSGFIASDPPLDGGLPAPTDGGVPNTIFPRQSTWYVPAMVERFFGSPLLTASGTTASNYDIVANFNSTLDTNPAACNGFVWYYGLDNQHGTAVDLLTVVLHELGHGLGFLTLTDKSTGEFSEGIPDIWASFLYDETSGSHWTELDAAGRAASVVSGALAWDGPAVKAGVPTVSGTGPLVRITSASATPSVLGDYPEVTVASFSAPVTDGGSSAPLAVGSTGYGCTALGRLAPLEGKIAILDRGGPSTDAGCTFVEKARNAQDAGAIGLLLANNAPGLVTPAGTAPDVVIPVLLMTQTDGRTLKAAVDAGTVLGSIMRGTIHGLRGADSSSRVPMYAPTALLPGSSVSHWDTLVAPNLLMEPIINQDLGHDLDLTVPLLRDIGWYLVDVAISGSGPATLGAGQQGTFTFTVTNRGPSPASGVMVGNALTGLTFVSNSGDCTTAFPCTLGDLPAGTSRTITTVLTASSTAGAVTQASVASSSNYNPTNDSAKVNVNGGISTPDAGTGGGGGGSTSGCAAALGPPAPWLALLGLLAFVRRRRPV